ncbi:hypothetical protein THAOC_23272, partial [Thalassiosira oceanica]
RLHPRGVHVVARLRPDPALRRLFPERPQDAKALSDSRESSRHRRKRSSASSPRSEGTVWTLDVGRGREVNSGLPYLRQVFHTSGGGEVQGRGMADDGRAKRLKSSQDGGVAEVAELRGRVSELESEIAKLRLENRQYAGGIAAIESEIEQLRRRGQGEGNHEMLPVVVAATVDLSRVDTSIVSHVTSFLASSRELLSLALTCKSFGWRQPMSTLNWSLVEEVARQTVSSRATDAEMGCLPQHATVCAKGEDHFDSVAVSIRYAMKLGAHYAEFLITGAPCIGIVRPMPGLDADAYQENFHWFDDLLFADFLAQRSDDWDDSDVHACEFSCDDGTMNCTDWDDKRQFGLNWEGMESCQSGDTVGMLLHLDEGTLTVYKNNRRLGVMKDGLSGPCPGSSQPEPSDTAAPHVPEDEHDVTPNGDADDDSVGPAMPNTSHERQD